MWTTDSSALVALEVNAQKRSRGTGECEIRVHFRPFRIQQGKSGPVKTTIFLASTAAQVRLSATNGKISLWTKQSTAHAQHEIQERVHSAVAFNPRLKVEVDPAIKAELESLSTSRGSEQISKAEFQANAQASLADKCIGGKNVEWHYCLHRGAKEVRDFLDETLYLGASSTWTEPDWERYWVAAELDDCAFFGPNRRRIEGLKAYLLSLSLRREGVVLPSVGKVVCRVQVE